MRAFKVELNGKRLCVAGIGGDGVLSTMVDYIGNGRRKRLHLRVGGLFSPSRPMLASNFNQTPGVPTTFTGGTVGFSANSSTPNTAFPLRLYTTSSGQIRVDVALGPGAPQVYEETDGWVLHRSQ